MVFCCFEQSYEEEIVSKFPEGRDAAKAAENREHDNTDNRKKVSGRYNRVTEYLVSMKKPY